MSQRPHSSPHAVVSCGTFRATLTPGLSMSFGRGQGHPLRLGHDPQDLRVPRHAGRLECRADGVLVHNTSNKRTLVVQTFPGPGYEILPLMVAGTRPHPQVKVLVLGGVSTYAITVDTRALGDPVAVPAGSGEPGRDGSTVGFERIETMPARHRRLLCALCLPVLTKFGRKATVPTYAEMEQILHEHGYPMRTSTIRNGLDELRSWLTYEHGIEGLITDTDTDELRGSRSFVERLAEWAILSGNVTDHDLDWLEGGLG